MKADLGFGGKLKVKRNRLFSIKTPLGRLWFTRDRGEAIVAGQLFQTHLVAEHRRDGEVIGSYDFGSGLVTTAGVTLLAADWTNATATIKLAKFHDSGTGTTAAAIGDTALQTPTTVARVTGTQTNTTNVYTTVATVTYDNTYNVTEWGLFTASTSTTLWDRRVFTAVPVINGDQITYSYSLTCVAGG